MWDNYCVPRHSFNKKPQLRPPTAGWAIHQPFAYAHFVLKLTKMLSIVASWEPCDKMDEVRVRWCLPNLPRPLKLGHITQFCENSRDSQTLVWQLQRALAVYKNGEIWGHSERLQNHFKAFSFLKNTAVPAPPSKESGQHLECRLSLVRVRLHLWETIENSQTSSSPYPKSSLGKLRS